MEKQILTFFNKFKQYQILYVNILFTLFCVLFPLATGIQFAWFAMWILIPIFMPTEKAFCCIVYMSLYMRVQNSVKLFSIILSLSIFIILIKELLILNKNKLLNKYLKIFLFYLILLIIPLFYSILVNKTINISFIYYLNMINLLFLFYLLKNKLNKQIILIYAYGIIVSCIISIISYCGNIHSNPFQFGERFCAFMPLCNSLSVSCSISISLIYVLFVNKKLNGKTSFSLISTLSLIGALTLSKNFFITLALILLVIFITQFKMCKHKKKFLLTLLLVLLVLSPFILYYGSVMFVRFFGDKSYSNIVDVITTGRLEKWLLYIKPWCKNIISIFMGLGLGYNYNTVYSSHSLYVGYMSKLGIVGLIIIIYFVYLVALRKSKSTLQLKLFPLLLILLICMVEDISYNTFNFIPFILALTLTKQTI